MAASSFEKEFYIRTDEGLANFIEVMKGNPLPLSEHPYNPAEAEALWWTHGWQICNPVKGIVSEEREGISA